MSILGSKEKAIERLYEALKTLVERRKRVGSNLNQGLNSSDGDDNVPACGTPACALGWYATTPQDVFNIDKNWGLLKTKDVYGDFCAQGHGHNIKVASEHFGIDYNEAMELFDAEGCNKAQSTKQAANYIERFIVRKLKEEMRSSKGPVLVK